MGAMGLPRSREVAILVRQELWRMRSAGRTFDEAWPAAIETALKRATRTDRDKLWIGWRTALHDTRDAWREAYDRTGKAMQLGALIEPEDSSQRVDAQLLA